jgi:hypothetical protein
MTEGEYKSKVQEGVWVRSDGAVLVRSAGDAGDRCELHRH